MLALFLDIVLVPVHELVFVRKKLDTILGPAFLEGLVIVARVERFNLVHFVLEF